MDKEGNSVSNETLAFGLEISIYITRPRNCFVMDNTGNNTHGNEDAVNGGQKKKIQKELSREKKWALLMLIIPSCQSLI